MGNLKVTNWITYICGAVIIASGFWASGFILANGMYISKDLLDILLGFLILIIFTITGGLVMDMGCVSPKHDAKERRNE